MHTKCIAICYAWIQDLLFLGNRVFFFLNSRLCIQSLSAGNIFLSTRKSVLIDDRNHRLSIIQMCQQAASLFPLQVVFSTFSICPFENLSSKYCYEIEGFVVKIISKRKEIYLSCYAIFHEYSCRHAKRSQELIKLVFCGLSATVGFTMILGRQHFI